MALNSPLIDLIREARSIDGVCPYVTEQMTTWEAQEVARHWRNAVGACAELHGTAEAYGRRIISGEPVTTPALPSIARLGVQLERSLDLLQGALDHHHHRMAFAQRPQLDDAARERQGRA